MVEIKDVVREMDLNVMSRGQKIGGNHFMQGHGRWIGFTPTAVENTDRF